MKGVHDAKVQIASQLEAPGDGPGPRVGLELTARSLFLVPLAEVSPALFKNQLLTFFSLVESPNHSS